MKIVSIMNGHNSTVGLFEDGRCKSIFHEEKFNNIKFYLGFPHKALKYVLQLTKPEDVDFFVITSKNQLFVGSPSSKKEIIEELSRESALRKIYASLEYKTRLKPIFRIIRNSIIRYWVSPKAKREIAKYLFSKYGIPSEKIVYTNHHKNHYLAPFFFYDLGSKNRDILFFTLDAAGDELCGTVVKYYHETKEFIGIAETPDDASLGLVYSGITKFLGMKVNEHEYKVMGLAAYVSNEKYYKDICNELKEIIWLDRKSLTFKSKFNTNVCTLSFRKNLIEKRFDNLASAVQKLTEDLVLDWISSAVGKTGISTICCGGGVFMNVKMNQKITELPCVEKVYFQPTSSDESLVIGAAAHVFRSSNVKLKSMKSMFYGLDYGRGEVRKFLKDDGYFEKYKITRFDNIEKEVARLLSKFNVVAYFRGKGEWGARSLCNRTILGNAKDLRTFYEVNDMVKMRDFWMPFAPTILDTWAPKYIKNWGVIEDKAFESTKYMILTFESTKLAQEHLRAAIHQKDKTLRPQIASKKDSPHLYRLLKYYEKMTGMGGFLNTSLNMHGYPLVGSLEQAMFTFENSGLKYIVIENFLIQKKYERA